MNETDLDYSDKNDTNQSIYHPESMMKKLLPVNLFFLLLLLPAYSMAGTSFIGTSFGLDYVLESGEDADIEEVGYTLGATAKHFFTTRQERKATYGLGATYIYAKHSEDNEADKDISYKLSGYTLDGMYNFSESKVGINYLSLSYGRVTEKVSEDINSEKKSHVFGLGLGGFVVKKGNFSSGYEIKYLSASTLENINGIFQAYLTFGYCF